MSYDVEYAQLQSEEDDMSITQMVLAGLATLWVISAVTWIGNTNAIPPCQDDFVLDYFP
jgi:hypothetical protein